METDEVSVCALGFCVYVVPWGMQVEQQTLDLSSLNLMRQMCTLMSEMRAEVCRVPALLPLFLTRAHFVCFLFS